MRENYGGYCINAYDELIPWLVKHATWTYNRYLLHSEGQPCYERRRSRAYNRCICELAETLLYRLVRHLVGDV